MSAPCPFEVTAPYDCVVPAGAPGKGVCAGRSAAPAPNTCVVVVTDAPAVAPGGVPPKSCVDFMLERAGAAPPVTAGVESEGGGAPCGAALNT
ncbi:hypothetical protein HV826_02830 [Myxococcus sp. AM010]|nr:hypothetical protein [Myxococcus sp. AM010]